MTSHTAKQIRRLHAAGWTPRQIKRHVGEPLAEVERIIATPPRADHVPKAKLSRGPTRDELRDAKYYLDCLDEGSQPHVALASFPATEEAIQAVLEHRKQA